MSSEHLLFSPFLEEHTSNSDQGMQFPGAFLLLGLEPTKVVAPVAMAILTYDEFDPVPLPYILNIKHKKQKQILQNKITTKPTNK